MKTQQEMKIQPTNRFLITILLCFSTVLSFSQVVRIESAEYLYWQPYVVIEFGDFQRTEVDPRGRELMEKYSLNSLVNVQIHCILDYPKKKKKIKVLPEQWYIAPAFCKKCSPMVAKDSLELEIAEIYFDIAEYCARLARKSLNEVELQQDVHGLVAVVFPRQVEEMYNLMKDMFSSFGRSIADNKENAIDEWKPAVFEMLSLTEEFATTAADCDRFIQGKPKSEQYKLVYEKYGQ